MTVEDCTLGEGVIICEESLVNIYGCVLGAGTLVGPFVEIQRGVTIGEWSKVESHTFICSGVTIGDRVFVGHHVCFVNDRNPRVKGGVFALEATVIEDDVSIGSGAVLLPVRVGRGALVGAGAVVTKNVPAYEIWAGVPAARIGTRPGHEFHTDV